MGLHRVSVASSLPEVVPSSSWEIRPGEIDICKKEDGSDFEIGSGGFGKVSLPGIRSFNATSPVLHCLLP